VELEVQTALRGFANTQAAIENRLTTYRGTLVVFEGVAEVFERGLGRIQISKEPNMSRRIGFTLIEVLVAMALTMFIMVILSQCFVQGLETFRVLKAIGDMQERLRTASNVLRTTTSVRIISRPSADRATLTS